jgi:outer membrane lipopolysaccharide assembly protein LptE/RlpB
MNRRHAVLLSVAAFLLAVLPACGYHLSSSVPIEMPHGITSLYIDRVENPSTEQWIQSRLISEVRDEFTRRGQVAWVDRDQAEGLLELIITRYRDYTKVESAEEETLRSQIALSMEARILSAKDRSLLWASSPVNVRESFTGAGEKREAERRVIEDAADALAGQLSAGF